MWELSFVDQMDFLLIANVTSKKKKVHVISGEAICSAARGLELHSCRSTELSSAISPLKGEKIEFSMMGLVTCTLTTHVVG